MFSEQQHNSNLHCQVTFIHKDPNVLRKEITSSLK